MIVYIDGNKTAVAPDNIVTVSSGEEIPYDVIQSNSSIQFNMGGAQTYTWPENTPLPVNPKMRLVSNVDCLVYGARD